MKIVCISDTHTLHDQINIPLEDGVLVHAGDALGRGSAKEFLAFCAWMAQQPHPFKLYVPGNHDFFVQKHEGAARATLKLAGVRLLRDEVAGIRGVRFYGSPWVPNLPGWAYYGEDWELEKHANRIPEDVEVLVTHGPAAGILDEVSRSHVGNAPLARRLQTLTRNKLRCHIFGHIHEGYGVQEIGGVKFVNAAICTREYKATNAPLVVEV